jgi:3-oxoacyl-[acyl-carrier-protein] synthase III
MAYFRIPNIALDGVAACVPSQIAPLATCELIPPDERERFMHAVGIRERRLGPAGLTAADLCETAARALIQALDWQPHEINLLIFVSQSADLVLPVTAGLLQQKLGLTSDCAAMDLPMGCSGYVYGLVQTAAMLNASGSGKALLLAGEAASAVISERDPSTYPLFGEAGSATALSWSAVAPALHAELQADGGRAEVLYTPAGGARRPHHPDEWPLQQVRENLWRAPRHLVLDGIALFDFTQTEVAANSRKLLSRLGRTAAEADRVYLHQANRILNEVVRKQLGVSEARCPYSLENFGNTSSASIPLTMVTDAYLNGKRACSLLLSGFGAGLSWGSLWMEQTGALALPLLER